VRALLVAALPAALALAACDDQSMRRQNRYETLGPADLFPDGAASRVPPEGAVAQGDLAAERALGEPPPVTAELLARGQERYGIACTPCHGLSGHGDGMIVARGFPAPPSYHEPRLRAAPARYFVDVITNGYGAMYSYAARVEPRDRWAIAAYIRALQLSQDARVAEVPGAAEHLP
jgi:mono/diheme cytochrome c family protein